MPRPCKRRRICALPGCRRFGVLDGSLKKQPPVIMTLDEFETIRLIDLEGLSQQQSAEQMDVARATVQAIYAEARKKLAICRIQGRELRIEGGEYLLCDGSNQNCRCCHCCKKQ